MTLYFRMHMKIDTPDPDVQKGTICDWEPMPAAGYPPFGIGPDEVLMLEATLTGMEATGAKSIMFDGDLFDTEYTHVPHELGGDINNPSAPSPPAKEETPDDIEAFLNDILGD